MPSHNHFPIQPEQNSYREHYDILREVIRRFKSADVSEAENASAYGDILQKIVARLDIFKHHPVADFYNEDLEDESDNKRLFVPANYQQESIVVDYDENEDYSEELIWRLVKEVDGNVFFWSCDITGDLRMSASILFSIDQYSIPAKSVNNDLISAFLHRTDYEDYGVADVALDEISQLKTAVVTEDEVLLLIDNQDGHGTRDIITLDEMKEIFYQPE